MSGYQAIVLAAGAGSRFGGGKMLAAWAGRPLVCAAVERALAAPVDEALLIVGCEAEAVIAAIEPLQTERLRVVTADDWRDGLSRSLAAGIAALPTESRGVLVFLGDMPQIPPELPARVIAALQSGATAVQPIVDTVPGHPVGLASTLYAAVSALTGDAGAGALLRGRPDVVHLAVSDTGATFDVDSREALLSGGPPC